MNTGVTVDLRGYDFDTFDELEQLVDHLIPAIEEDYPEVEICGIVISDHQQKMLRLERYMNGEPISNVKRDSLVAFNGMHVITRKPDESLACPSCGNIHDCDQPWYPHE